MTVTEFLEARIAEDEAAAERGGWHNGGATFANDNYGCLLVQPARVLAECAAKRAIIEQASEATSDRYRTIGSFCVTQAEIEAEEATDPGELILKALAAVYSDHPDYDKDWAL